MLQHLALSANEFQCRIVETFHTTEIDVDKARVSQQEAMYGRSVNTTAF